MQKRKFEILSTKILDRKLVSDDWILDEIPFIEVKEIEDETIKRKILQLADQNVVAVFTSSHAAEIIGKYVTKKTLWKIYCIGSKTKEKLLHFFSQGSIADTAESASDLAWKIMKDISVNSVVFFCSSRRRDELPEILVQNGIGLEEVMVYETIATPKMINKEYDGILFFSPSGVESFFSVNKLKDNTACFAIGETTASSIEQYTTNTIITCAKPTRHDILDSLNSHFKNSDIDEQHKE